MPASGRRRRSGGRRPHLLGAVLGVAVLVASGVGVYVAARETSLFAVQRIEVDGGTPDLADEVRAALAPFLGRSLVTFDARAAHLRLAGISELAGFEVDRAFPHTLRVAVRPEKPVAVLRRGADAWLVAASGRVLHELDRREQPRLPRLWVPIAVRVEANGTLAAPEARGVQALAVLGRKGLPARVRAVRSTDAELTLVLADGPELRLGNAGDLELKLAIARRILPLTDGATYLDISVPERAVAGHNPQVES